MSKKVYTSRKSIITLEPDGYSVHTVEVSLRVSKFEFNHMKDSLYQSQKTEQADYIYTDRNCKGHHICIKFANDGIRIRLEENRLNKESKGCYIRMVINPRVLIYPQSGYLGILPKDETSVELLGKAFRRVLKKSPFEKDLSQYYLSRVDLCTNIRCNNKKVFRELVRLLQKTATPKKYQRMFYQHKHKKKANQYNKHYIRLACGQQELVIYDKTYQLTENDLVVDYEKLPAGVLRVEVHYGRDKLRSIEKKHQMDNLLDLLWLLMQESEKRILKLVGKCYSDLPYLSYEDGQQVIGDSSFQTDTKERMLILLEQMQRKQTLDKAFQYMGKKYKTSDLLERFQKLGLNPIPLRKGYAAKKLPSLLDILKSVGTKPVQIELKYWKWK